MKSTNNNFGSPLQFAMGVDVSKKELYCCLSASNSNGVVKICASRKFDNTAAGLRDLALWLKSKNKLPAQALNVCVEPTSTYHEAVLYSVELQACNIRFFLVQPNRAKAYAASIGQNSKNDKTDAEVLARFALTNAHLLQEYETLPKEVRQIRDLLRQRTGVQEQKTIISNQKHAYTSSGDVLETTTQHYDEMLDFQEKMADKIEKAVENLVKNLSDFAENCQRLMTIKGVGLITAATILSEFNQFKNFQNISQAVAWSGLNIVENQSGNRVGRSTLSKKGNRYIRRVLYCPALSHVREKGCFAENFNRLQEKNKNRFHKSIVSVMRKLLILSFSMTKNKTDYCPEKHYERVAKSSTKTPFLAAQ